jgi:hypothetical protein
MGVSNNICMHRQKQGWECLGVDPIGLPWTAAGTYKQQQPLRRTDSQFESRVLLRPTKDESHLLVQITTDTTVVCRYRTPYAEYVLSGS